MSDRHRSGFRSRSWIRAAIVPVALLVLGVLVWQGSTAAFTATTDNTGNTWAAGALTLTNDGDTGTFQGTTAAVFSTAGTSLNGVPQKTNVLVPGATGAKCIAVKATGNFASAVRFNVANVVTGTPNISNVLTLNVKYGASAATGDAAAHTACDNWIAAAVPASAPAGATATTPGTVSTVVPDTHLNAVTTTPVATTWTTAGNAAGEYGLFLIQWTLDAGTGNTIQGGTTGADFVWTQTAGS
ncbi:hypothetical protein GIS00_14870 [Nakamurella sp. YIM 132087]|uniref:Uncharacterized protein n=1 Tax=Nakamurella alba TaxID=2665158 RepID=A0A7K1FPQ8_9ACTN|nr:hypothetical protein [Nakamurella alba]MTD15223.1 hypothetical protein [Nakamurella alba]